MEAFDSNELPIPRTPENVAKFEAHVHELRERLDQAEHALYRCRERNPLP